MTQRKEYARRRTAIPAAAAVLAAAVLAGCSSGHVGESWQCPLARGGTCDSVAAADPAVPDAGTAQEPVLREPLYRPRAAAAPESPPEAARPCDAGCGFDPLGWLVRLFGAEDGGDDSPSADDAPQPPALPPEPAAADLPAEPDPADDDLRTGEVVGRIWIAPFVDADGVYREASHVRAVLEPAGWRVP